MDDLLQELKKLKQDISKINKRIYEIEKAIHNKNNSKSKKEIMSENALEFYEYLLNEGLNEHTVKNYFGVLRSIRRDMNNYLGLSIESNIYDIENKEYILELKNMFKGSTKLQAINKKQHNSYSAALNNYINFLNKKFINTSFEFDD